MNFVVTFHYRRKNRIFLVKVEQDDIFIAFPRKEEIKDEPIFLTKVGGQWVGDNDDKNLVAKIGAEIDSLYQPKENNTKTAA